MNEVIQTIKKRRSVRSYDSRTVPKALLSVIIEAANEAPSAMNSQPWRFVVVGGASQRSKVYSFKPS